MFPNLLWETRCCISKRNSFMAGNGRNASEFPPKFILEIVAFDDTTSLTAGCWGTLDATETKESISTKTRIQRFHHDKVREVTPLFLVLCFCCTRRCFGWFLTWFGFVGVDVAYHISNWIEWRVNVVFLVESCYISWFKKLSLFICGYTLYLLRNSWKFLRRQFVLWWLQVGFDAIQITLFDIVIDVSCCITLKPQLVAVSVSAQRHSVKDNIQNAPRKRGFRWSISRDLCLSPMIFISSYEESMFALSRHRTSSTGESKSTEDWISSFCLNENYCLICFICLLHLWIVTFFVFFQRILGQDEMPLVQAHIKKRQGVSILFHWSDAHLRPGPGRMMGLDGELPTRIWSIHWVYFHFQNWNTKRDVSDFKNLVFQFWCYSFKSPNQSLHIGITQSSSNFAFRFWLVGFIGVEFHHSEIRRTTNQI